jgi:hypothetical protein
LENKQKRIIVGALRNCWLKSPNRYEAIKNARIKPAIYICANCKKEFKLQDIRVHHINPIDKFNNWDELIDKLFCESIELECLCIFCHSLKHKK